MSFAAVNSVCCAYVQPALYKASACVYALP